LLDDNRRGFSPQSGSPDAVRRAPGRAAHPDDRGVPPLAQTELRPGRRGATANLVFGQTEDQVNKLKLLKRQMYGRATFAFLRHRFLLTA
jgi:hypothetical protein